MKSKNSSLAVLTNKEIVSTKKIDVSKKNIGVKLFDFSSSDIKLINPSEWSL